MFAPSISSSYFANVLFRLSYELPGKERTGRCGVPCLCTFANPYSLAGCAHVDLNLVYSVSLISSFFFMASTSLFMSYVYFIFRYHAICQILPLPKIVLPVINFSNSSHMSPFSLHKNPRPYQTALPEDRCPSNTFWLFQHLFQRGSVSHS